MKVEVIVTPNFKRQAKKLLKKYPSLKTELANLEEELKENPYKEIKICLHPLFDHHITYSSPYTYLSTHPSA